MNGRFAALAGRIRQETAALERAVERFERAISARQQASAERDLLLDSAALNLHNVPSGLERIFSQIASTIDQYVPSGTNWRRELLQRMTIAVPGGRPEVLPADVAAEVEEFLRFRHVVRHIYAFELDPERVERLASRLRPVLTGVNAALLHFATYLETVAKET